MKIKDLKCSLGGVVFLHPETREWCIWASQWQKGVWYRKDSKSTEVFPLFLDDLKDALEFDLAPSVIKGLKEAAK